MEGAFEGSRLAEARARRETIFDTIQAYFLFQQYRCWISLDDIEKTVEIKHAPYLKRRLAELGRIVQSFSGALEINHV